jgi:hypothetical protein
MPLLAGGLHGAHRRDDLVRTMGRRSVGNVLASGVATALWRGTVVESRRLLDPRTRAAAALLTAGPDAALCGPTAARLHGLTALDDPRTHVVLPHCRGVRSRGGLVVHHAEVVAPDAVVVDGLRVLALDRVVADLLCTLPRPRDGLAVVDEALRRAGERHDDLRSRIGRQIATRRDPRGTVIGASLLDLACERSESVPESWIRWSLLDHGFPIPEVNHPVLGVDGQQVRRIDLAWPHLRIAFEYDGYASHVDRKAEDAARTADLERRGWIVVRMSTSDLTDLGPVLNELRGAIRSRGYTW